MPPVIRPLIASDDISAITALVHSAYAPHAAAGLRYWGTHQTIEQTASRLKSGTALVMLEHDRYIGIVIVRPPQPDSTAALYREPKVWSLSQFCVAPEYQGRGFGRSLHDAAVRLAAELGAETVALDTAQPAARLIAMYQRWGYTVVGTCDWRPHTNYLSVLMQRSIVPGASSGP